MIGRYGLHEEPKKVKNPKNKKQKEIKTGGFIARNSLYSALATTFFKVSSLYNAFYNHNEQVWSFRILPFTHDIIQQSRKRFETNLRLPHIKLYTHGAVQRPNLV